MGRLGGMGELRVSKDFSNKNKKNPSKDCSLEGLWNHLFQWKKAVTYSPALHCSTIGASRLNFSVRNGKRWNPAAIATWYGGHVLSVTDFYNVILKIFILNSSLKILHSQFYILNSNWLVAIQLKVCASRRKAFGQLVVLGFDVAVFTPAPYQRRRLRRPSMEF